MDVFHIFHFISNSHISFLKVRLEMSRSWFCSLPKISSRRTGPDTRCNYLWREWVTRHCVYWLLGNSVSCSCKTLSCHLNFRSAMMAPTPHWCLWEPSSIPLFPAIFSLLMTPRNPPQSRVHLKQCITPHREISYMHAFNWGRNVFPSGRVSVSLPMTKAHILAQRSVGKQGAGASCLCDWAGKCGGERGNRRSRAATEVRVLLIAETSLSICVLLPCYRLDCA